MAAKKKAAKKKAGTVSKKKPLTAKAKVARKPAPSAKKAASLISGAKKPAPPSNASAARQLSAPSGAKKKAAAGFTVARIREAWLRYFKKQNHLVVPSAALIPAGDPTLLFTTAGMVQFKPYFSGEQNPPAPRIATIQKCLRTTDLESVGKTDRHLTFFEMLGNFSFGDYFKEGAIRFAWDFSLNELGIDPERIWVTVYKEDDEAEAIWHKTIGLPMKRINRLGKADNWWGPAGESGACGPCTELYLDRGEGICTQCTPGTCQPGGDCERFMEYWNLVFNQYNQTTQGQLEPLPRTGIDTGAGLERIAALVNGVQSVYDTDELLRIRDRLHALLPELRADGQGLDYTPATAAAFRVLCDHARSAAFAIADGIFPGNTGRGYVIRRIIRRALLFARALDVHRPVLFRLIPEVVEIYEKNYPELGVRAGEIAERIRQEEERFLRTLGQGIRIWEQYLEEHRAAGAKTFGGEHAFRLYDTFGFPLEMTRELAEQAGLAVDQAGFDERMRAQQKRASEAGQWQEIDVPAEIARIGLKTEFIGYAQNTLDAKLIAAIQNGQAVERLGPGPAALILDRTPFYAEGGGQLGDTGRLTTEAGAFFRVDDTRKKGDLFLHIGELVGGELAVEATVRPAIDSERREGLTRHHSATHLLNRALRDRLGNHILQTGSLVAPDYLRFDFSHSQKVNSAELEEIEASVITAIRSRAPVATETLPIEKAREKGAVATFGEKYGDVVRVVSMGGGDLSIEFCGGCHVNNTGEIRFFHIVRETSPGAGNRRIEAIAGEGVIEYFQTEFSKLAAGFSDLLQKAGGQLTSAALPALPDPQAVQRQLEYDPAAALELSRQLSAAREYLTETEKGLARLRKKSADLAAGELLDRVDEILAAAPVVGQTTLVRQQFENVPTDSLRKLGDAIKEKQRNTLLLLGTNTEKGPGLLFMANRNAVEAGIDCGQLIRLAAGSIGGGGGGRPDMAQAGGKNADGLTEALERAENAARGILGG